MKARLPLLFSALLVVATLLAYRHVNRNGFVNLDDPYYVQNNPLLVGGLSWENAGKAFTKFQAGYWIPLTWISLQADYELYGMSPGGYHRTNLLLHLATVLLLFHVLRRLTKASKPSFVVAALFALHPIQVESVAWVTERKDVLSTFFWVLTTWAYLHYVERPSWRRYVLIGLALACGLMAKPMLVTLPCTLLLLDFWPLRRWRGARGEDASSLHPARSTWQLVLEKIPLLMLALAAGAMTVVTQDEGTAVKSLEDFSVVTRIENAVVSYVLYLGKIFWPTRLAVFYPHPGASLPLWKVLLAASLLLSITVFALVQSRRRPFLIVGWLWFLGTLFPVSGILQSGWQGMADRFAYVPAIGIFVMAAWSLQPWLEASTRRAPRIAWGAVAGAIVCCALLTQRQVSHWRSSLTLWEHAKQVTPSNFMLHHAYGAVLLDQKRFEEAAVHLQASIEQKRDYHNTYHLMGVVRFRQQRFDDAIRWWQEALKWKPDYVTVHARLAVTYARLGEVDVAERHAQQALALDDQSAPAHYSMAMARERQGRYSEAVDHCRKALELNPHAPYQQDLDRLLAASQVVSRQS